MIKTIRFNGRADWMSEDEFFTVDADSFAEATEKVAKNLTKVIVKLQYLIR